MKREGRGGERETGECVNPSVNEKCVAGHDTWQRRGQNLAWSREPLPTSPHPAPWHTTLAPCRLPHCTRTPRAITAPLCCICRNPIRPVPCQPQNAASYLFRTRVAMLCLMSVKSCRTYSTSPAPSNPVSVSQAKATSTVTSCLYFTSPRHALQPSSAVESLSIKILHTTVLLRPILSLFV